MNLYDSNPVPWNPEDNYFGQPPTPPKTEMLFSQGLLSKWGFHDGDLLEWLFEFGDYDRRAVLCAVVRKHLIPALKHKVDVQEIETIHNPIRLRTVDDRDVTDEWYDPDNKTKLTPEYVEVSGEEILAIAKSIGERPRP